MAIEFIRIRGAREHNLKNINLDLPRNSLIVFTGLSGSGKSSLAFDTIYAEGQRRYVESLSAYARQFLGQMEKPDVDDIEGLSPAISIDQKGAPKNPRSTVATVTEIYDYFRLLFARIGIVHCPNCKKPINPQTVEQMVDRILALPLGTKVEILAPLVSGRKGEYHKLFPELSKEGFSRVRVDKIMYELEEDIPLSKTKKHSIEVVVDRLKLANDLSNRLADSLEIALQKGNGVAILIINNSDELILSEQFACVECSINIPEITPRAFSFNSPYGACPVCTGLGIRFDFDPNLILDKNKSIYEGAILPWGTPVYNYTHHAAETHAWKILEAAAKTEGISLNAPLKKLSPESLNFLLYGSSFKVGSKKLSQENRHEIDFSGVVALLKQRYERTSSWSVRTEIERYMDNLPCHACEGARLKPEPLAVTVHKKNITQITRMPISTALDFFQHLELTEREEHIAHQVIKEILGRLSFLMNVGLGYLTLDRSAGTLSGGEAQRIRLATQIGSQLTGVLYILDEPSIGLHQRDNLRLLNTLKHLRDLGNTVIVVEHDEETIREADFVVDIGPGAGVEGGRVVAAGALTSILKNKDSITGRYLSREMQISIPDKRRKWNDTFIELIGAKENNLKNISVKIPLGLFICVTGVSGSGKSTLVNDILYKATATYLHGSQEKAGIHDEIRGLDQIDKVIVIDQSPIGRTPRSNPATYTGTFDPIREIFSITPEAKVRGYKPGRFSFNLKGGRCEACQGDGTITIEMHFLPDVYIPCEVCKGKRYNRETLEVTFKGKNIADVLDMTILEALSFFSNIPKIERKLQTLYDVGLGYIRLGQPATTLSGGEAQRVKLATELSRQSTGHTLYVLDEPTTGLHFHDIAQLLKVLDRFADAGNTVLVIEHNLDVIKRADWIIDLGPEGGDEGGYLVAEGPPEVISKNPRSYTGKFLKHLLLDNSSKMASVKP